MKPVRIGPVALSTTTTTNIAHPPVGATGGVNVDDQDLRLVIEHIRIVSKVDTDQTYSLWIGATGANAAGTEFMGSGMTVAARDAVDWYGRLVLGPDDYLVGGADAATSLTFEAEGYLEPI